MHVRPSWSKFCGLALCWKFKRWMNIFDRHGIEYLSVSINIHNQNYKKKNNHSNCTCKFMIQRCFVNHRYELLLFTQIKSWAIARFPVAQAKCNGVRKSSLLTVQFTSSLVHRAKHNINARISLLSNRQIYQSINLKLIFSTFFSVR